MDKISLDIEEGEISGLLGPNGAGRTTIILILSILSRPTSNKARLVGFKFMKEEMQFRKSIRIVFQDAVIYNRLIAMENFRVNVNLYF